MSTTSRLLPSTPCVPNHRIETINHKTAAISIDLNSIKVFTDHHLETYKRLNPIEKYPWLFGKDLPESLTPIGVRLVNFDDVEWKDSITGLVTQGARAGGKNPKIKEISRSIAANGFKLSHPAIAVLQLPTNKMVPLDGRSRREIIQKSYEHVKNFIASVYEVKEKYQNPDGSLKINAESDISIFSTSANSYNDPSGDTTKESVVREVNAAIANKWIKNDRNEIRNRVDRLCGLGVFTDRTRSDITFRIFNQYSKSDKVLPWDASQAAAWRLKNGIDDVDWLESRKLNGGDKFFTGIKYCVVSSETLEKSAAIAAKMSKKNPSKHIRVLIHTGILRGFDVEQNYLEKVENFRKTWENYFLKLAFGFFEDRPAVSDRISLFGALPAIQSIHNLKKMVKFVTPTTENPTGLVQSE
jgi:hypothetical protein